MLPLTQTHRAGTLASWVYVKKTHQSDPRGEFANMMHVSQIAGSDFPIPKPLGWFTVPFGLPRIRGGYILMTRVSGQGLDEVWLDLTQEQKLRVTARLAHFMSQMRAQMSPQPSSKIGAIGGRAVNSSRLSFLGSSGPFTNEEHLNRHLRGPAPRDQETNDYLGFSDIVHEAHSKHHALVFTHGDLFPRNVIVDEELNIKAIIDWEAGGWFPEHFEWCVIRNMAAEPVDMDWREWASRFLTPWNLEELADKELLRKHSLPPMWTTHE
jgi:hypothetical protein